MLRVDRRDEADFLWLFNEAEGEIRNVRSTWPHEARAKAEGLGRGDVAYIRTAKLGGITEDVGLRCGRVYVPSSQLQAQQHGVDGRAVGAVTRARRIRQALAAAGDDVELVLRLRYREVLTPARSMFSVDGSRVRRTLDAFEDKDKVRRERARLTAIARRSQPERGPGMVAHLTDAAKEAWEAARTTLPIERWVDRLGQRLTAGSASEPDRALQRAITREADVLVLRAYERYRRASIRVPELVRRRAAARAV